MPQAEWLILMGIGGLFLIVGIAFVVRGKHAEGSYRDSLSTRTDMREFLEQDPQPKFESLRVGGWIALAVGLIMLGIGIGLRFWG